MKLAHLKNPAATVCVLECGDSMLLGHVCKGEYGNNEDCVLLTFSGGPDCHRNDIEICVPEWAWNRLIESFRKREPEARIGSWSAEF